MSNRYRITFNVTTESVDDALYAVDSVAALINEHRCIVESHNDYRLHDFGWMGLVTFLAAGDGEADDLVGKIARRTGLPPLDAIRWSLIKKEA